MPIECRFARRVTNNQFVECKRSHALPVQVTEIGEPEIDVKYLFQDYCCNPAEGAQEGCTAYQELSSNGTGSEFAK